MNKGVINLAAALAVACAVSVGCGSDDDAAPGGSSGSTARGGSSGAAGKGGSSGAAGKGGSSGAAGKSGAATDGGSSGASDGSAGSGGDVAELAGGANAGAGGNEESGGEAGTNQGGAAGEAGGVSSVERGARLVRSVALCGGCHTAGGGTELAGNAAFKGGSLPAPNLTPDATGIGDWTDAQIINAIRNGVDDEGRHLDPIMPYWLFHNMTDDDAEAIVAFLRSLPPVVADLGSANPEVAPVTPLAPSAFPESLLPSTDANYAAAQQGRYLLSGVAQCVKCHSTTLSGLPTGSFFAGAAPLNNSTIFSSNITPDSATGIGGWTPQDVANALKLGKDKANVTLCGSMPSAAKGYGGLSDADAYSIGVYLSTIPAVSHPAAAPSLEPACP